MMHPKNTFKNNHFIVLLLVSFVLILVILFAYLQKIDKTMKKYYAYQQVLLDTYTQIQDLDNIFLYAYRHIDNDKISNMSKKIEKNLSLLDKRKYMYHSNDILKTLKTIHHKYQLKAEYIESFKTLNSRITNAIYYLYRINNEINKEEYDKKIYRTLERVLFKIGQLFIGSNLKKIACSEEIVKLEHIKHHSKRIKSFYRYSNQFKEDVEYLEDLLENNTQVGLRKSILKMNTFLNLEKQKNKDTKDAISFIFFICAFFLLLGLIHSYLKIFSNQKEMYYLAYHDTLTMLPNRLQFEEYILSLIENKKQKFILLFIDLDRFKVINDTLGHDIGDAILITISKRLKKTLGKKSFIARLGGDEFIAIIQYTDLKKTEILLNQLIKAVRKPLLIKEYHLNITSSIGVVKYPQDAQDKHTLLKYADSAMYHAKDVGKDTYAFYNSQLSIDMHRRLELEQELTSALKKEEFRLMFQPQYNLKTQEMVGVEALVRWDSPLLGSVSPDEFISVAEDIGLIIKLGYHIFREACLTYMYWKDKGLVLNLIAINISSMQFRQLDAFENFKKIIQETGMNPHNIEIELTERYIMEYSSEKLSILDELRSIGCKISIDDFGTGYSSMSYLKRLSIDTIKIDKSFVDDLEHNKHDAEVSKAIILLSQTLGYQVIAEGIESKIQEDILRNYGCDMGQGYYFSKPISKEELIPFYHQKKQNNLRKK